MNYSDQLRRTRTNSCAQLEQPFSFLSLQKDPLLRHSTAEHLVFNLEQFDLQPTEQRPFYYAEVPALAN